MIISIVVILSLKKKFIIQFHTINDKYSYSNTNKSKLNNITNQEDKQLQGG